ncbi:MAG: ATP-binding cassette domain-containing protein [Deltaproteobacteria bacterium]|nr:ATP-binding cassette domain-containing protein [Deltaproteobacteria bacterium]
MAPLYRLESVRMAYGTKTALAIPALTISEGRVYVLVGPNGSGKSTLLSLLAFLRPPASGTLHYDGGPVPWKTGEMTRLRREAVLLHQTPYLFDDTVSANAGYGLRVRGVRGAALRERVAEALAVVGLPGFERRPARALSGGEAQRVAMARILALKPRVLLLDEPLANVDRDTADVINGLIGACSGNGTTVVVATHDAAQSDRIATDVIRLAEGALSGVAVFGQNELHPDKEPARDARI